MHPPGCRMRAKCTTMKVHFVPLISTAGGNRGNGVAVHFANYNCDYAVTGRAISDAHSRLREGHQGETALPTGG